MYRVVQGISGFRVMQSTYNLGAIAVGCRWVKVGVGYRGGLGYRWVKGGPGYK